MTAMILDMAIWPAIDTLNGNPQFSVYPLRTCIIFRNVLQLLHANIGDLKDDTGKPPRHIDGGQPSRLPYKTVSVSRLFAVRAVCYLVKLGMLGESFPYPKSVSGLTEGAVVHHQKWPNIPPPCHLTPFFVGPHPMRMTCFMIKNGLRLHRPSHLRFFPAQDCPHHVAVEDYGAFSHSSSPSIHGFCLLRLVWAFPCQFQFRSGVTGTFRNAGTNPTA